MNPDMDGFTKSSVPSKVRNCVLTKAVESEVPSSDSDSWQFRSSDSDSGPTPTFSCISYLLKVIILFR